MQKRRGFTLIEVIVALGIFMIVLLALLSSYYSYYNSIKQMTYKAIGQNLAELLLEDVRSLPVDIVDDLLKSGQYPEEPPKGYWERYINSSAIPGCYEPSETPDPNIPDAIPFPADTTPGYNTKYDSGEIDSSYRLQKVASVFGVEESSTIPQYLLVGLPSNIVITPVYYSEDNTFFYTILLNKEIFPYYKRRVVIEDLTPGVNDPRLKIYRIAVTILWNNGQQSITVTGEKSFRQ